MSLAKAERSGNAPVRRLWSRNLLKTRSCIVDSGFIWFTLALIIKVNYTIVKGFEKINMKAGFKHQTFIQAHFQPSKVYRQLGDTRAIVFVVRGWLVTYQTFP